MSNNDHEHEYKDERALKRHFKIHTLKLFAMFFAVSMLGFLAFYQYVTYQNELELSKNKPLLNSGPGDKPGLQYFVIDRIVDGDTIRTSGGQSIRLSLVDAPEMFTQAGQESKGHIMSYCHERQTIAFDIDDLQIADHYGRLLGVVYCDDTNINQEMIQSGYADTYKQFCSASEFAKAEWSGC